MPVPRRCSNPACENAHSPGPRWFVRDGTYTALAHGRVQRYRCLQCSRRLSAQTESMHYFAKRRLDLRLVFARIRGGSSLRDIARCEGCSAKAITNAVVRLGRQAMAAHQQLFFGTENSGSLCFDGLVSVVCSRDYQSQITTLADRHSELLLAMTHAVCQRGGTRTEAQERRIRKRKRVWRPKSGSLGSSISLLVNELSRFASRTRLVVDTDEHPLYSRSLARDAAIRWYENARIFAHRRTPGAAARTTDNRLFVLNYIDRMIRHRLAEHTRGSIAIGRNATMQMHRMWIFAWDHNAVQPRRVGSADPRSRAEVTLADWRHVGRLKRWFFTRRVEVRSSLPQSMQLVWLGKLETPPVRWKVGQRGSSVPIPQYAKRDMAAAYLHGG